MFHVRLASPADYDTFARLFLDLEVDDPVPTAEEFVATMLPRVVMLEGEAKDAVGYAFFREYGTTVHVVNVVVDRSARGKRGGEMLLADVRERARKQGCLRLYLNVRKNNEAAIRMYTRAGLRRTHEGWSLRMEWKHVLTLEGEDAPAFDVLPEHDDAVAARLGIDRDRIPILRAHKDAVLVGLRDRDGSIAAFGAFNRRMPGVYPIGVARVGLTGALFRAIHPHAEREELHVFVEGNRALADCLLGAGATLVFELDRMTQDL